MRRSADATFWLRFSAVLNFFFFPFLSIFPASLLSLLSTCHILTGCYLWPKFVNGLTAKQSYFVANVGDAVNIRGEEEWLHFMQVDIILPTENTCSDHVCTTAKHSKNFSQSTNFSLSLAIDLPVIELN